jgi:hypothetical protein
MAYWLSIKDSYNILPNIMLTSLARRYTMLYTRQKHRYKKRRKPPDTLLLRNCSMFINTSNRLTNFYTSNKLTIDTLLLIVQLVAMAIALLGLLSLLGWVLAISQVIAWLNKLVEDSLANPQVRLLMPSFDMLDTQFCLNIFAYRHITRAKESRCGYMLPRNSW